MLVTHEVKFMHSLDSSWMYTQPIAVSISPIFLTLLQNAYTMTEGKQASCPWDLTDGSHLEEELKAVVVVGAPSDIFGDGSLVRENGVQPAQLSESGLFTYQGDNHNRGDTICPEMNNVNGNYYTDASGFSDNRCSPDWQFVCQLSPGERHVHKSANNVSEVLSVPLYCSTSGYSQGDVRAKKEPSTCSLSVTDVVRTGSSNNENQTPDEKTTLWARTKRADSHVSVPPSRQKSHIHSCPDLHSRQRRRPHDPQDRGQFGASLADWSPVDPQQPAVLKGIDESVLIRLPREAAISLRPSSSSKCRNTMESGILSLEAAAEVVSHELRPNLIRLNSSPVAAGSNNLFIDDTHVSQSISDLADTNRITMQNLPEDYSMFEPSEDFWNPSTDRRSSTSDFLIAPSNGTKRGPHEHIELSSLSPTQRKRKFRRRRSASLPKRSQGRHPKPGKTNKLCKKKNKDNESPDRSGASPGLTYGAVSSSIMTKSGKRAETPLKAAREKSQFCSSLLCTGLQTSWKDCITNDGSRAPLVVLYEPEAEPSVSTSSFQGHYGANARSLLADGKKCIHIRRRSSVDKVKGVIVDAGEFTVVPVRNEINLQQQQLAAPNGHDNNNGLRVPLQLLDIDGGGEPGDTLTQNSITSLLSAKFRDVAKRWKQYGVDSPRFRKRLHSKWESMNYEESDSQLQRVHNQENKSRRQHALNRLSSWVIYFFIGVGTAFMAAGVQITVEIIAQQKFGLIRDFLDKCSQEDCLFQPVILWVSLNAGITVLGAVLVTYVQPMAAGSGIPLIKSYLNGVRVPGLLSLRAFVAKCLGVVLSILGGLACGKEGPMAHSGGIVAAGLGKGRIPWFNKDISLYGLFRNDHNIRDLVAAGAASGVSAAFGAPVGGTLFSVEEAASFWNTELVWKVFFSAMIACFSTNVLLSAFEGHPTQLSNPGLVRFNIFPNLTFDLIEIPVFIFMAAIGGLIGSLFVVMNYKLTVFRQKYLHRKKWIKVVEAGLVAVVSAVVAFILMLSVKDCTTAKPYTNHAITTKMGCSGDSHNSLSTLFLTTPEGCLKALLHDPLESYSVISLVLFVVIFFLLGVWTYGLSVSSGVFIPSLAIGAAWGRLIGLAVVTLFPDQAKDVGKYALIGAASQLGGILRTTISLTVILVECTGDINFGLCIMITLMISKWVGDFFTTGLYDMNIAVSGIPLLSWEPPALCEHIYVNDFMSQPVMTLLAVEKVGHIYDCLTGETFHGFPVIEQDLGCDLVYKGKLKGIILRHQILVLLKKRIFCPEGQVPTNTAVLSDFENSISVSQSPKIEDIVLSDADKECVMSLSPYMHQSPYTVSLNFSMARVFRLFRGLGLRHLIVVNDEFEPIGMVTRKDLAKYRAEIKRGLLHMEQLTVENR